ncbi:hypothetical protein ACLKMH_22085 [Psychromonas sp. KJ10-10]|uniref:hypothetical protein n=1 Tax=Psychromonas sp. KJ10-10 TaxID=3391823 RepID=UPI0039B68A78
MPHSNNMFLVGSLPSVFMKTVAPIILMMMVNGSFSLVDAYFLGEYVGAHALACGYLCISCFYDIGGFIQLGFCWFFKCDGKAVGSE